MSMRIPSLLSFGFALALLLSPQDFLKAEEFSLEFPAPSLCPAEQMPYRAPTVATIQTRIFERRPEFEKHEWGHNFPNLQSLTFYAGDFNCDGRSDLLAHEEKSNQMFLGLSDTTRKFSVSSIGMAPENLRWEFAQVAPYHQHSCAALLLPRHQGLRKVFAARFCGGNELSWQEIDFPDPRPEFRDMLWGDALTPGSENFFSVPFREAPYFTTQMFPNSGGGREKLQSHISPQERPGLGVARWSGNERSALVIRVNSWDYMYTKQGRQVDGFMRLPRSFTWDKGFLSDLNGDSLTDLVVPSRDAQGSWIALAYGDYRLLFPNVSLTRELRNETIQTVGDFDGNGKDELLLIHGNSLYVISQRDAAAIPFQQIHVGKHLLESDEQGRIQLPIDPVETIDIKVAKTERGVVNPLITRRNDSRLYRPVTILFDEFPMAEAGAQVRAPNLPMVGPYLCSAANRGGQPDHSFGRTIECPSNFAFLELDDSGPLPLGTCCRLPADDILTSESSWTSQQCTADTILTALRQRERQKGEKDIVTTEIRCTKINTARYSLSSAYPGHSYGEGGSLSMAPEEIDRSRIPLAYRGAFGKSSEGVFDNDGCVGQPWGSVLTAVKGKDCKKLEFRTLLERDPQGILTPIPMYPQCQELSDPYDPSRGCLP